MNFELCKVDKRKEAKQTVMSRQEINPNIRWGTLLKRGKKNMRDICEAAEP